MKGSLIQQEGENLQSISFIMEGKAEYISAQCMNKPYLECGEGDHFGLLDILFRQLHEEKLKQRKDYQRELRKRNKYDEDFDESDSSSSDEEDFAKISQKLKCKFTIRAQEKCKLL